ncbi:MAG: antitoxin MazE family protein [Caulobacterales bacterium]|jgi:hypothetical protein
MARSGERSPAALRAAAYRERMRSQGLRRIDVWVPDVRSPEFAAEARRQSALTATSEYAANDQGFIDATSDLGDD